MRFGGSHLPLRARPMYGPRSRHHKPLIHEFAGDRHEVIPEILHLVDRLWRSPLDGAPRTLDREDRRDAGWPD
jgi:hypothetical protein